MRANIIEGWRGGASRGWGHLAESRADSSQELFEKMRWEKR